MSVSAVPIRAAALLMPHGNLGGGRPDERRGFLHRGAEFSPAATDNDRRGWLDVEDLCESPTSLLRRDSRTCGAIGADPYKDWWTKSRPA
mmetsp:Transcript_13420/g.22077  ORF Transcript_13420/g.22077 Transcript_13420/m.22077 type:complete len:90 (-) Transcript_13420:67-336(-)